MKFLQSPVLWIKNKLQRVSLVDRMMFTRNLGAMLKAGLSLPRIFKIIAVQTKNKKFKRAILQIKEDIQKGQTLASAMAQHPSIFNELYIGMIKVGETGGSLEQVFKILSIQMKKDHTVRASIKNALVYPAVILTAMIGIGILMGYFIVPKLLAIFEQFEMQLPLTTRLIIFISRTIQTNGPLFLLGIIALIIGLKFFLKKQKGKKIWHGIILRLPIFGKISKQFNCARFARTLSSLTKSGISIIKAFETLANTIENIHYRVSIQETAQEISKGTSLDMALKKYPKLYPILARQMIAFGEETGQIDNVLEELAEFYEDEIDQVTRNLSAVIEPVLMIIIGAAVGLFAVSMLQPMYSMLQGI